MRILWTILWAVVGWLLAFPSIASSGAGRFEHLTSDDGLSQMNVLEIFQDQTGFMWFATQDGTDRFDGADFEHLPNIAGPMWQPPDGSLWIGDRNRGLFRIDLVTGAQQRLFRPQGASPSPNTLSDNRILALSAATGALAWVGTMGGLDLLDADRRLVSPLFPPPNEEPTAVYGATEVRDTLYFVTARRLHSRQRDGAIELALELEEEDGEWRKILGTRGGALWLGGTRGLDRYDPVSGQHTRFRHDSGDPYSIPDGSVSSLLEDRRGDLWIGFPNKGLARFEAATGRFLPIVDRLNWAPGQGPQDRQGAGQGSEAPREDQNAKTMAIGSLFEDRSGTLWVGLAPGGVKFSDPGAGQFDLFRHHRGRKTSLSSDIVLAIEEASDGGVWVGTWFTGLSRLDPESGDFEHFRHDPEDSGSLGYDRVHDLLFVDSGELWIGLRDGGLDRHDTESGLFEHFRHDPNEPGSLSHNRVMSVVQGPGGSIWAGTSSGLDRFRPESGDFEHFRHDPQDPTSLSTNAVQHLFVHGEEIWVSTWGGGLNRFVPQEGLFERFRHDPQDPTSLANDTVRSSYVDSVGRLWVATNGSGLDMKEPGADGFRHFRVENGLANDVVQGVLEDALGRLWIPTNGGLSRYDPELDAWASFDAADGLQHAEFNFGAFHAGPSGFFYLGGIQGFNRFDPMAFPRTEDPPRAVLTHFEGLGQPIELDRRAPYLEEIRLKHQQNAFSFELAALSFKRADRNRYQYRLEPFDDVWIEAGSRRFASYTNVPPGEYTLRARVTGASGVWSQDESLLKVRIATPPWRSVWAYSLYALMVGGLIFGFARWQRIEVERQREINRRLRDIDRIKDQFLANTSHELRTPLFGITGLAESLIDGVHGDLSPGVAEDLEMISSSGHRLARLVNDLLDFSKLERGRLQISPRAVDLHALTDVVLTLSRPLLQSDAVELRNAVPRDLPSVLADEERLEQILHNLIGNAVKFTPKGLIEISARRSGEKIELAVTDTGIGIAEEHQSRIFAAFEQADASIERSYGGSGLGLAVARGLVDAHGAQLRLISKTGEGSRFFFFLPISKSDSATHSSKVASLLASSVGIPLPRPSEERKEESWRDLTGETGGDNGRSRLLIVDDEPVNLKVLSNFLVKADYQVRSATNGPDALRLLEEENFDLLLLDVMMPKMSGYEVCRAVRKIYGIEELPVIFLTAKSQEADRLAGFADGANDFLSKPVTKSELLARVSVHLKVLDAYRQQQAEVKVLSGMLPICSSCKKIRDDEGYWNQLETFIRAHSEASFTHGICPSCLDEITQEMS